MKKIIDFILHINMEMKMNRGNIVILIGLILIIGILGVVAQEGGSVGVSGTGGGEGVGPPPPPTCVVAGEEYGIIS